MSLLANPLGPEQATHLAAFSEAGVQLDREAPEGQVNPDYVEPDSPSFGDFHFAFTARGRSGHRTNIWVGSTSDIGRIAPLVDETASFGDFDWSPSGDRILFDSNREDGLRVSSSLDYS